MAQRALPGPAVTAEPSPEQRGRSRLSPPQSRAAGKRGCSGARRSLRLPPDRGGPGQAALLREQMSSPPSSPAVL